MQNLYIVAVLRHWRFHVQRQAVIDFGQDATLRVPSFRTQLLKWIGNKQRFAHEIAQYFPQDARVYREPFLGSGAVLGTLAPKSGFGSDGFEPLAGIWKMLKHDASTLKEWYRDRWEQVARGEKVAEYEKIKKSYNEQPNSADLLFLCRSCYGGVVRFRKSDGYMSTPCGVHSPISPANFSKRVAVWKDRVAGTTFEHLDYLDAMAAAKCGDLVYCDPPYSHSQTILYGAQAFNLARLFEAIAECKQKGVRVVLSIDGSKKSGSRICDLAIPAGLFERETSVNCGRSMLRRFQMNGQTLESEVVTDRLLLTY